MVPSQEVVLREEVAASGRTAGDEEGSERDTSIIESMRRHRGNVSKVAAELGLHRPQIYTAFYRAGHKPKDYRAG